MLRALLSGVGTTDADEGGDNLLVIILLILAAVLILAVVALLIRRQRAGVVEREVSGREVTSRNASRRPPDA